MARHRTLLVALLALGLALPGCQALGSLITGQSTSSKVYDLGDVSVSAMDEDQMHTFTAMVRDVVGQEEWTRVTSSIHVLNDVLLIRTSSRGHERLNKFFSQFRAINDSPRVNP